MRPVIAYLVLCLLVFAGGFLARQRNGWHTRSDFDKTALSGRVEYALGTLERTWAAGSQVS